MVAREPFEARAGASPVRLPWSNDLPAQTLRMIAMLRVALPVGEALVIVMTVHAFGIALPLAAIAAILALQILVALLTWKRLRNARTITPVELLAQVHVDILLLTAMLYLTGGTENPFAALFVLPVAIAASALDRRWVWLTAVSTVCCYVALHYFRVPLAQPTGNVALHELHALGTVVNYALIVVLIAFFVARIRLDVQRHSLLLADVHKNQMRHDSTLAMGALAAGCAHELSSPLGTIAVVVTELQRERPHDRNLQEHLKLVAQQVEVTKQAVSNLTGAAGQRRAEAAGSTPLDRFLHRIVEQAQAVHPGATIRARIGEGEPAPLIAAEETLRQAFANLIDNAVRACPCDVHVLAEWSGTDFVFAVCDDGPGFPPGVIGKLVDPVRTIGALEPGAGLGLLLTDVTLGRLGGSLTLTNKPQGGARVEARLPLRAIVC